jgi:ABC-2 type transport system permease protein
MLNLLLRCQLQKIKRFFATRKTAKIATLACFLIVFVGLGVGIYFFFVEGFSYFQSFPFFAQALTLYGYEAYLLLIFILIVASSFIFSLFSLFKKQDNDWLLATPSYKILLGTTFFSSFFSSLWPLVIIVLPSLLAAHTMFGLKISFLIISLATVVLLTAFTTSAVLLIILFVSRLLQWSGSLFQKDLLSFKRLTLGIIFFIILGGGFIWHQSFSLDLISLFNAQNLEATASSVSRISNNFIYSPAHPVAKTVYELQNNNVAEGYRYAFIVFFMTVVSLSFLWLATEWFLPVWQKLQEGSFVARVKSKNKNKKGPAIYMGGSGITALFKKEVLVSVRNSKNVLWFSFLALIWLMQVGINLVLSKNIAKYGINADLFPIVAYILQFLTGVFFISAFVLRFVFPSFSMEKNTAWILGSAPLDRGKIFWSKLLFYLPLFLILGILIGYANLLILNFSLVGSIITFILFFSVIVFTVVLGLALGAVFPNFETDDPSALSTSLPGIGFIAGSLAYGLLGAFLLFKNFTTGVYWPLCLFLIITYFAIGCLVYIAPAFLKQADLIRSNS